MVNTVLERMVRGYQQIFNGNNYRSGNLLGIIRQTFVENNPRNYYLAMEDSVTRGSLDGVFEIVGVKVAFTNKALLKILKSVKEIYRVAKKNANRDIGLKEITDIIEKEYNI